MSRDPHRDAPYWVHSAPADVPEIVGDVTADLAEEGAHGEALALVLDGPSLPAVGSGLCPVPHRGGRCEHDDGNPRRVAHGLLVCNHHLYGTTRKVEDFPDLWEILGDTTRTRPEQLGGRTKSDAPPAPNADCLAARTVLEHALIRVERAIHAVNTTPVVSSAVVRAQTRQLMVDTSQAIDDTTKEMRDAEAVIRHPEKSFPKGSEPSPLDLDQTRRDAAGKVKRARDRLAELKARWDALDQHSRTGRDVITARAERVARHLPALLADPDRAVPVVLDLEQAWRDANNVAHPLPEGIRVACPKCGTRVRLRMDGVEIWCPGEVEGVDGMEPCGEHGYPEWWALQLGVSVEPMTEDDAVRWLAEHHRIKVDGAIIRSWAHRGRLPTSTEIRDGQRRTVYHPLPLLEAATTYKPKAGAGA